MTFLLVILHKWVEALTCSVAIIPPFSVPIGTRMIEFTYDFYWYFWINAGGVLFLPIKNGPSKPNFRDE